MSVSLDLKNTGVETSPLALLVTPFSYDDSNNFNVNVDAVISRHSGAKTKNGTFYPTGLGYISSVLKEGGIQTKILDVIPQGISNNQVHIYSQKADIIIMPISSTRFNDTKKYLLDFRDKIRIGISNFASIYDKEILEDDICDFIIHGEVEYTCRELIAEIRKSERNLSSVNGISFLQNGKVYKKQT